MPWYLKQFKWAYWIIEAVDIWTAFGSKILDYFTDLMEYGYLIHLLIVLLSHFFHSILTTHPHLRRDYEEHGGISLTVGEWKLNQYAALSPGLELLISSTEKKNSLLLKMIYQHKKSNFRSRDCLLSQTNWSRNFKDATYKMLCKHSNSSRSDKPYKGTIELVQLIVWLEAYPKTCGSSCFYSQKSSGHFIAYIKQCCLTGLHNC